MSEQVNQTNPPSHTTTQIFHCCVCVKIVEPATGRLNFFQHLFTHKHLERVLSYNASSAVFRNVQFNDTSTGQQSTLFPSNEFEQFEHGLLCGGGVGVLWQTTNFSHRAESVAINSLPKYLSNDDLLFS